MKVGRRATSWWAGAWRAVAVAALWWLGVAGLEAEPLRVVTYNLQNYTLADRRTEEGFRPDYPKPEEQKAALRAVMRDLDADVFALQEIGGQPFLEELRRDLAREGVVYAHGRAMLGADEERGLAVLSRVPLGEVREHRDLVGRRRGGGEAVRRGMLEVELLREEGSVTLFVVHLKSRLAVDRDDPQAEEQRVAEAQAVRDRILERFPDPGQARFVILGDFNDLPGSRALQAFEARGKTRIASGLAAVDSRGHGWTHRYARRELYSRFDHVLLSTAWAGIAARAWVYDGPETVRASDHRPLVLELP
jgi:endonuclease/exonuclease/phosphatase family metal-dependent hydrolase